MGALRKPGAEASRRPSRRRSRGVRLSPASTTPSNEFAIAYATAYLDHDYWVATLIVAYQAGLVTQHHSVAPDQYILWPGLLDCE